MPPPALDVKLVTQLPFRQTECFLWHQHVDHESAACHLLAVPAMTFECHDGLSGAFVTNRSAYAAASKWNFHTRLGILAPAVSLLIRNLSLNQFGQ